MLNAANDFLAHLLTAARDMMLIRRPSTSEYESLRYYCKHNGQDMDGLEIGWTRHKEDLVTLRPGREHAWLDRVLEKLLKKTRSKIARRIFCSNVSNYHSFRKTLEKVDSI